MRDLLLCILVGLCLTTTALEEFQYNQTDRRIANGKFAREHEYPHMVSVMKKSSGSSNFHFCAGGLINKNTVLLAAHCFDHVKDASTLSVKVGALNVKNSNNGRIVKVKRRIMHPKWDPKKYKNGNLINDHDVALMYLEEDIEENGSTIRYMDVSNEEIDPYSNVDVAGWGYMYQNGRSRDYILRGITIPVIKKCPSNCKVCRDDIQICAGDANGHDSCKGDSGTPLTQVYSENDKRWTIVGVLSFGSPSGASCGAKGAIGVYTRISVYKDWIWENAEKPPESTLGALPYIGERFKNTPIEIKCNGKLSTDSTVCSGKGECLNDSKCHCEDSRYGEDCEFFRCFGKNFDNSSVCNGNGVCKSDNLCECDKTHYGFDCARVKKKDTDTIKPDIDKKTILENFINSLSSKDRIFIGIIVLLSFLLCISICCCMLCLITFFVIYYLGIRKIKQNNQQRISLVQMDQGGGDLEDPEFFVMEKRKSGEDDESDNIEKVKEENFEMNIAKEIEKIDDKI